MSYNAWLRDPPQTERAVLRKAIIAVVTHRQMNIAAISHGAAVNSPDRPRGTEAASELWKQSDGSSAVIPPHTGVSRGCTHTHAYGRHTLPRCKS